MTNCSFDWQVVEETTKESFLRIYEDSIYKWAVQNMNDSVCWAYIMRSENGVYSFFIHSLEQPAFEMENKLKLLESYGMQSHLFGLTRIFKDGEQLQIAKAYIKK